VPSVFTDMSLPTISGNAVEGEVLQEGHASWSSQPIGYGYQWQRCNSMGQKCEGIAKARSQSYLLTAADVGHTIRVGEDAEDSAGSVTPAVSEPTAVVQAHTAGGQGGEQGTGHGGTPGSCCTHFSASNIRNLLVHQLAPSGRAASIASLLRNDGLSMSFRLPQSGTLTVQWFYSAPAAKHRGRGRHAPTLVATGRATLTSGKTVKLKIGLTAAGRRLLAHTRKISLEAKASFAAKGHPAVVAAKAIVLRR